MVDFTNATWSDNVVN